MRMDGKAVNSLNGLQFYIILKLDVTFLHIINGKCKWFDIINRISFFTYFSYIFRLVTCRYKAKKCFLYIFFRLVTWRYKGKKVYLLYRLWYFSLIGCFKYHFRINRNSYYHHAIGSTARIFQIGLLCTNYGTNPSSLTRIQQLPLPAGSF